MPWARRSQTSPAASAGPPLESRLAGNRRGIVASWCLQEFLDLWFLVEWWDCQLQKHIYLNFWLVGFFTFSALGYGDSFKVLKSAWSMGSQYWSLGGPSAIARWTRRQSTARWPGKGVWQTDREVGRALGIKKPEPVSWHSRVLQSWGSRWSNYCCLVVWNMVFMTFHILGIKNHPNWRTPSFFRGVGWNHQPDCNRPTPAKASPSTDFNGGPPVGYGWSSLSRTGQDLGICSPLKDTQIWSCWFLFPQHMSMDWFGTF